MAAGWLGAVATVGAYALVTQRRIEPDSMRFQGLNAAGATLLATSAAATGAWPSLTVNFLWMLIGAQAMIGARHVIRMALTNRMHRIQEQSRKQRARVRDACRRNRRHHPERMIPIANMSVADPATESEPAVSEPAATEQPSVL